MEKRLLVAIFLTFLVLYGYQILVLKPAQEAAAGRRAAQAGATTPAGAVPARGTAAVSPAAVAPERSVPVVAPVAAEPLVAEGVEREIVVDTQAIRAVFSNRGARLRSWRLKSFLDLQRRPQELVPQYVPAGSTRPFDLTVDDEGTTSRLREILFRVTGGENDGRVDATRKGRTVAFEYRDSGGLAVRKTFSFEPRSFIVKVSVTVEAGGRPMNPTVLWGPGLGDQVPGAETSRYSLKPEGIIVRGDKVQRLPSSELAKQPVQEGDVLAAGVDDQYFIAVALPVRTLRVEYAPLSLPGPAGGDAKQRTELVGFGVRQAQTMSDMRFFFGPKDFDVLQGVDTRLVRVINFGMFDFLAVPLLRSLKWINVRVGNYGWSIIILTFLINAIMFPLRHKSMVSMRKMQELQPEVKRIQDRYGKLKATDPERQKMNTEMMSLYKEKGVNPASGCVPMLLTLPVLFAFYSLLSAAIEIRGEPFIFWIKDLSSRDPYYVTPVLMGASQLAQQWMTPSSADPVQQKMMLMMPLVFTFMFLWMPSGLVVYWLFSNVLAIGQQYITNHVIGPPPPPARPAAERRVKSR
jgi:YidC/Oxa1 family membrane protein insertase